VLADYLGGDGGVERGRGRASSIGMGLVTWKRGGVLGREVGVHDGIYWVSHDTIRRGRLRFTMMQRREMNARTVYDCMAYHCIGCFRVR
jgi:hypothetical protein